MRLPPSMGGAVQGCGLPTTTGAVSISIVSMMAGRSLIWAAGGSGKCAAKRSCLFRTAWCAGFLIFVYDGDYWGYEFFDRGEVLDHFVQEATGEPIGFPGKDCRGNPRVVADDLPVLACG